MVEDLRKDVISISILLENLLNPIYYYASLLKYFLPENLQKIQKNLAQQNSSLDKKETSNGNYYCDLLSDFSDILYYEGSVGQSSDLILDLIDFQINTRIQAADIIAHSSIINTQIIGLKLELKKLQTYIYGIDSTVLNNYIKNNFPDFEVYINKFKEFYNESYWRAVDLNRSSLDNLISNFDIQKKYNINNFKYQLYKPITKSLNFLDPVEVAIHECKKNNVLINKINPHDFEKFIGEIFQKKGYRIELTKKTRDGGRDLFCFKNINGNSEKIAIEVKRYSNKNPISISLVQKFVGANIYENVDKMIFVTTSRFTKPSLDFKKKTESYDKITTNLELIDFDEVCKWIDEY